MAGACGRDVDVDDFQFRPVNFDHNGLVLEVGVVWEQGVEVDFLVWEGVVDQCDETITPTRCSAFPYGGIIWEKFRCVGDERCVSWMMATRMLCFWWKSWGCLCELWMPLVLNCRM